MPATVASRPTKHNRQQAKKPRSGKPNHAGPVMTGNAAKRQEERREAAESHWAGHKGKAAQRPNHAITLGRSRREGRAAAEPRYHAGSVTKGRPRSGRTTLGQEPTAPWGFGGSAPQHDDGGAAASRRSRRVAQG